MDQQGDLLGILVFVLAVAMLSQFGLDYLRTHQIEADIARWAHKRSVTQ